MSSAATNRTSSCRRCMVNVFIALLLLVFACDTMPCTPGAIRSLIDPPLDSTGLWQGTWSLFAPIPDSKNHRLRADLYYADGSHLIWRSPEWRSQNPWQRFLGHRESEFIENIWIDENSAAWPGFATWLAKRESSCKGMRYPPQKVELSVIWSDVPPPDGTSWPPQSAANLDQQRLFFTLIYPESD